MFCLVIRSYKTTSSTATKWQRCTGLAFMLVKVWERLQE